MINTIYHYTKLIKLRQLFSYCDCKVFIYVVMELVCSANGTNALDLCKILKLASQYDWITINRLHNCKRAHKYEMVWLFLIDLWENWLTNTIFHTGYTYITLGSLQYYPTPYEAHLIKVLIKIIVCVHMHAMWVIYTW